MCHGQFTEVWLVGKSWKPAALQQCRRADPQSGAKTKNSATPPYLPVRLITVRMKLQFPVYLLFILWLSACGIFKPGDNSLNTSKWALLTIDFAGPQTSETAAENPFTDYRLDVHFKHSDGTTVTVPAYFAADGKAAESSAEAGNTWRVNFRPPATGSWTYHADLKKGSNVATSDEGGKTVETFRGTIEVGPALANEMGRLVRNHPRYLQWAETGKYFLKGGTDSPENFLAYHEFDNTYRHSTSVREGEAKTDGLHQYEDHVKDFKSGPTWQGGKGKGIIGAIQYLHDHGANSFYFLTFNINGDGKDVWPYLDHKTFDRFDVSKLAQWERVLSFADDLGMMLHIVLQETENETMLDDGDTGPLRKLYFREIIARFGHHRAITWNLGEENGINKWSDTWQTTAQQEQMIDFLAANDPGRSHVVLHTHPGEEAFDAIYRPLLGNSKLGGLAIQTGEPYTANQVTEKWLNLTAEAGAPWILSLDEVGPHYRGLDPDSGYKVDDGKSNNQDSLRALTLWGNLLAGGMGVEWYFGYRNGDTDLSAETFRTREKAWAWTKHAVHFFQEYLPFQDMNKHNELVTGEAMCFAKPGEVYAVYLPFGKPTILDLGAAAGAMEVGWYNAREGGTLTNQTVEEGGKKLTLRPPGDGDWAVRIMKKQ